MPLFGVSVLIAAAVLSLLFLLDPSPRAHHAAPAAPSAPPPAVYGGFASPTVSAPPHAPARAVVLGRRFLRLYARLQTKPLDAHAARQLRGVASLALAHTLLAQPPQPGGGGHAPAALARVRVERLSSSAVLLHAAIRHGHAVPRVRCLVQLDRGRWTVTALTAAA